MKNILFNKLTKEGYNFFCGVPDSGLKEFQNSIIESNFKNVIATNEGQAIGIAVGAMMTGLKPCVYMQNSGLGNAINPLTSLCAPFNLNPLLVIGHRHTLPQHKIMGEVDENLLNLINYKNYILIKGDNNEK